MSQTDPAHTRGAIIADLACVVSEISELQVAQAKINEQTAKLQSRVGHMIHLLSCTSVHVRASSADVSEIRERLDGVRGRLEATAREIKHSAERMPPAAEAAPPSGTSPSAQNAGEPVRDRKALDVAPERDTGKGHTSGQSRECVTSAGAGGTSSASADTAPAADETKREASVRAAGGGLVQDGGSLSPAANVAVDKVTRTVKDRVLDRYAEHGESAAEIATALQLTKGSVSGHLSIGRTGKDPRAEAGDKKRFELLGVAQTKPTPRDIADSAQPTDPDPAPAPAIPTGGIEIPAGKLIAVRGTEVHGPAGIWRTSRETAKAFGMIADGQLYGLEPMARHGGLNPMVCVGLIPMWTAAIAKIGLELHYHKGFGLRLRPTGGQH